MLRLSAPTALRSPLRSAGPNRPITLYKGTVLVTDRLGRTGYVQASLRLKWLPSPSLELAASDVPSLFGMGEGRKQEDGRTAYTFEFSGTMTARFPGIPQDVPALITEMGSSFKA